jgi:hypothetical protein
VVIEVAHSTGSAADGAVKPTVARTEVIRRLRAVDFTLRNEVM